MTDAPIAQYRLRSAIAEHVFPANCDNRLSFDAGPPHPLPICDHSALPSTSVTPPSRTMRVDHAVSMVAPTSAVTISCAAEILGED